jgi:formylglycine-generating enzyme required for sulfatase activity
LSRPYLTLAVVTATTGHIAACSGSGNNAGGHMSTASSSSSCCASSSSSSSSSSSTDEDGGGANGAPSCQAGGPGLTNCGPGGSGTESCCTSLDVEGGTFYRTYANSGSGPTGEADPATLSSFRLDKYLITVGRFRQYVNYLVAGGSPPADGSGKHAHLNAGMGLVNSGGDAGVAYETGWNATNWDQYVLTGAAASSNAWDAKLSSCAGSSTWTSTAGSQESWPITCIDWYEAYAFCIWDGGFLPSEAEWEYVAAGGSQQREYPWGQTDPGTTRQYEIYADNLNPGFAPVGTATLGASLWGQLDMLGDAHVWGLDWYTGSYVDPCTDCAYLAPTGYRVERGIGAGGGGGITSFTREAIPPTPPSNVVGARCARTATVPSPSSSGSSTDAGIDASISDSGPGVPDSAIPAEDIVGNWQYNDVTANGVVALVLWVHGDGTYASYVVTFPSAYVWDEQEETGTYVTSGSTVTFTPEQWTCSTPDPPKSYTFAVANGDLTLSNSTGAVVYAPQVASDAGLSVALPLGCFGANGFETAPLAPVVAAEVMEAGILDSSEEDARLSDASSSDASSSDASSSDASSSDASSSDASSSDASSSDASSSDGDADLVPADAGDGG